MPKLFSITLEKKAISVIIMGGDVFFLLWSGGHVLDRQLLVALKGWYWKRTRDHHDGIPVWIIRYPDGTSTQCP